MMLEKDQLLTAARRRGRAWALVSTGAGLAAALAIGLLIVGVITHFQHDLDHLRRGQILLMRLDRDVTGLNTLERQIADDPSLVQINKAAAENLEGQARQELTDLTQIENKDVPLAKLEQSLATYLGSVEGEFRQFETHPTTRIDALPEAGVAPAREALADAILDTDQEYDSQAQLAYDVSDDGTVGVLLSAALLVFACARRIVRAQRFSTRIAAEQEVLRRSEERFRALLCNTSDVIAILTPDGLIRYLSAAAERLWGYAPALLENTDFAGLLHPDEAERSQAALAQVCARPQSGLTIELRLRHADGCWHMSEAVLTNLLSDPGIGGILLTCRDISERKAFEEKLAHQAFHDPLTKLPNRALFMARLQHALSRAKRHQTAVAVLFLDLDNFKVVNDGLGHEAGDRLLAAVGERLCATVRAGDTVARLGGDEFTILVEDDVDEGHVLSLADRIVQTLRLPVLISGREVFTSGSLGVALCHGGCENPDDLLRNADVALYRAKATDKAHFAVFDSSMNTQAKERLELDADLRRALEYGELRVHYQPIIGLAGGEVREVEALVRWEHPTHGLLAPGRFIPLAEENGLIVPLGLWVLEEACRQTCAWQHEFPGQAPLTVSVNLSARQMQQPSLLADVVQILERTGLAPSCLKLEITESVMLIDTEAILRTLLALKALGVRLAVDDFGTGYSSMSYLSNLPVDTVKIDRSFVGNMGRNPDDYAIVRAIVTLAKALNLCITSEGIETEEQLAHLRELGCDQGQGFHVARPLPASELTALLAVPAPSALAAPALLAVLGACVASPPETGIIPHVPRAIKPGRFRSTAPH